MHAHSPPIDLAKTNHNAVARITLLLHTKVAVAMGHVGIYLLKTTLIQQTDNALASGEFAFGMLGFNPLGAAPLFDPLPLVFQFCDQGFVPINVLGVLRCIVRVLNCLRIHIRFHYVPPTAV